METKNILLNIYTLLLKGVPRTLYTHLTGLPATCAFLGNKRASATQVKENGTLVDGGPGIIFETDGLGYGKRHSLLARAI